ncbi:sensor histidine kinase [Paenibacillus campi]|uniref:sensor histidine kinase n=1 Tax=Paenibacillus campi TaxID=3106031 RepID=UPI002AFE6F3C|nr:sensor histidine kinase [Paenibacillus sp. SGZ-1014]
MKRLFKHRPGFRKKLIIAFIYVSLLPVLIVQALSYYFSSQVMETKINHVVQNSLIQTSKGLDITLDSYEDILFQIFSSDQVVQLVRNINAGVNVELNKNRLMNVLSGYSYAKQGIRSVSIFTKSGVLVCYDLQTGSPYQNLWSGAGNILKLPIYEQIMQQKKVVTITLPQLMDTINSNEHYMFHIGRKLNDFQLNEDGIGAVIITLYESVLSEAINSTAGTTANNQLHSVNYLVDKQNQIVSAPDEQLIGKPIATIMNNDTISNTYTDPNTDFSITNITMKQDLFRELYTMQRISLTITLLAIALSIILIIYFSGNLTKSVQTILRAMKMAQTGTLTVQITEDSKDEMALIAAGFNRMMNQINELVSEVKMSEYKKKESEIRALEAQINPHFLYNTLDSINWLAIEKDEHEISEMLQGLAQILRYSIKDSNKMVTLEQELNWTEQYVFLQQHRFCSSFTFELDIEPAVLQVPIYKLLLQPFIENAIIHGFAGISSGGVLRLSARSDSANIVCIVIRDNGCGMEPEVLHNILQGKPVHAVPSQRSGMGVRNALDRIGMYYGERARYELISTVNEGTEVRLWLPCT